MSLVGESWAETRRVRQAAPAEIFTGSFGPGMTVPWAADRLEQVKHLRLWTYVAIHKIASKIAEQPIQISRVQRTGRRLLSRADRSMVTKLASNARLEPVEDSHPLRVLIDEVNEHDTLWDFLYEVALFLGLTGVSYIYHPLNRANRPMSMWVLASQHVRAMSSKERLIAGYRVQNGAFHRDYDVEEILEIKFKSPLSKLQATSPAQAGAEFIDNSESMQRARWQSMSQGIWPGAFIEIDPSVHDLDEEDMEKIAIQLASKYAGRENFARPVFTRPGMKIEPATRKPSEMDFTGSSPIIRDEVLALWGVPKVLAGIVENVNRATLWGADAVFCRHTIAPWLRLLGAAMTEKLARKYADDIRIWFPLPEPSDPEMEIKRLGLHSKAGAIEINELREGDGRDPVPYGNTALVSATSVPVQSVVGGRGGDEDEDEGDDGTGDNGGDEDEGGDNGEPEGEGNNGIRDGRQATGRKRVRATVRSAAEKTTSDYYSKILFAFLEEQRQHERRIARAGRRFWGRIADEADSLLDSIENPEETVAVESFMPRDVFERIARETFTAPVRDAAETGAQIEILNLDNDGRAAAAAVWPKQIDVPIPPDIIDAIRDWTDSLGVGFWRTLNGNVRDELVETITEGLADGESMRLIRNRISATFGSARDRSMLIARTETTGAMNAGMDVTRRQRKVEKKRWLATLDSRVRGTHLALNDTVIPNDDLFQVGGYQAKFPGDQSLGPEERCNCRCSCVAEISLG